LASQVNVVAMLERAGADAFRPDIWTRLRLLTCLHLSPAMQAQLFWTALHRLDWNLEQCQIALVNIKVAIELIGELFDILSSPDRLMK